jgi:hypothetical protein
MIALSSSRLPAPGGHRGDGLGGVALHRHRRLPLDHRLNARRSGSDQLGDRRRLGHVAPVLLRHLRRGRAHVEARGLKAPRSSRATRPRSRRARRVLAPSPRARGASSVAVPVQRALRRQDRPAHRAEPVDEEPGRRVEDEVVGLEPRDEMLAATASSVRRKRRKACILCRSRRTALASRCSRWTSGSAGFDMSPARRAAAARSARRAARAARDRGGRLRAGRDRGGRGSGPAAPRRRRPVAEQRRRLRRRPCDPLGRDALRDQPAHRAAEAVLVGALGEGDPPPRRSASGRRHQNRLSCSGGWHQPARRSSRSSVRGRWSSGDEEGQRPLQARREPGDVGEPQPPVPAGGEDAVHRPLAEAGDAQQEFPLGRLTSTGNRRGS